MIGRKFVSDALRHDLVKRSVISHNFNISNAVTNNIKKVFNGGRIGVGEKRDSIMKTLGGVGCVASCMMSPKLFWESTNDSVVMKSYNHDWFKIYEEFYRADPNDGDDNDRKMWEILYTIPSDVWSQGKMNFKLQDSFRERVSGLANVNESSTYLSTIRYDIFHSINTLHDGIVPPIDVDIVWHSHMLSAADYHRFCHSNFGRTVDHNIHSGEENSGNAERSIRLWNEYVDKIDPDSICSILGIEDNTNVNSSIAKRLFRYEVNPFESVQNGDMHIDRDVVGLIHPNYLTYNNEGYWDIALRAEMIIMAMELSHLDTFNGDRDRLQKSWDETFKHEETDEVVRPLPVVDTGDADAYHSITEEAMELYRRKKASSGCDASW